MELTQHQLEASCKLETVPRVWVEIYSGITYTPAVSMEEEKRRTGHKNLGQILHI